MRNKIIHENNIKCILELPKNSIDLVYIDPPFYTQERFSDFNDSWESLWDYLSLLRWTIKGIYRILKEDGIFILHCDYHSNGYLRVECDKIFGYDNLINEIIWKRSLPKKTKNKLAHCHDTIYIYARNKNDYTFHVPYGPLAESSIKRYNKEDEKGKYMEETLTAPGSDKVWDMGLGEKRPRKGRGYRWSKEKLQKKIGSGEIYKGPTGRLVRRRYLKDSKGSPITTLWDDIHHIHRKKKGVIYDTQKPEKLLERIIKMCSNEGDLVGDFYCGSGTTCVVAKRLNRNYIGCDKNKKAIEITKERLKEVDKFKKLTKY